MFNETTWLDGEKLVQDYMNNNGYKILWTNFSCVGVELDIVSLLSRKEQIKKLKEDCKTRIYYDKNNKSIYKNSLRNQIQIVEDLLVITEVKARESGKFGTGADAISDYKIQNIKKGARYLQEDKKYKNYQIRFDVASVDAGKVNYIENAF